MILAQCQDKINFKYAFLNNFCLTCSMGMTWTYTSWRFFILWRLKHTLWSFSRNDENKNEKSSIIFPFANTFMYHSNFYQCSNFYIFTFRCIFCSFKLFFFCIYQKLISTDNQHSSIFDTASKISKYLFRWSLISRYIKIIQVKFK